MHARESVASSPGIRAKRLVRLLRLLGVGICYVGFALFGLLFAYLVLPWVWLVGAKAGRRRRAQRLLRGMCRGFFAVTSKIDVAYAHPLPTLDLLERPGALVIVANHPSLLDIIYLFSMLPPAVTVAKVSWFRSPLVGPLVRACGYVCGPEHKRAAAGVRVLEQMLGRLEEGEKLLVFPEGTRSPRGSLHPFARGAFDAALKQRVPVLPLLLDVTPPMLRKGQPWWESADQAVNFRVRALDPCFPESFPKSSKELCREMHALYERELSSRL